MPSKIDMEKFKFTCATCGEEHEGSPSFGYKWPHHFEVLNETDKKEIAKISDDMCIINDEDRFIRVVLEVPIKGYKEGFMWGVWISVSETNFLNYQENFDSKDYEDTYFGWFCNILPFYPETLHLKTNAFIESGGQRPKIDLELSEHPLTIDYNNGISWERAVEIAQVAMHGIKA